MERWTDTYIYIYIYRKACVDIDRWKDICVDVMSFPGTAEAVFARPDKGWRCPQRAGVHHAPSASLSWSPLSISPCGRLQWRFVSSRVSWGCLHRRFSSCTSQKQNHCDHEPLSWIASLSFSEQPAPTLWWGDAGGPSLDGSYQFSTGPRTAWCRWATVLLQLINSQVFLEISDAR